MQAAGGKAPFRYLTNVLVSAILYTYSITPPLTEKNMPCNAITYQKAEITEENLLRLLAGADMSKLATSCLILLREKGISCSNPYTQGRTFDIALSPRGRIFLSPDGLVVSHQDAAEAERIRDILLPLLRAVAVQRLQEQVAEFAAASTKIKTAQRLSDGTLLLKVSF